MNLAFIVPDYRKQQFARMDALRHQKRLRIGVLERPYFGARLRQVAPDVEIVLLDSPREFFEKPEDYDALVMSAEAGSAWTLLNPQFSVVIPEDGRLTVSVGYPMPIDAMRLENVVSRWIDLKRKDGTVQALYDHWIEGKTAEKSEPRWNIMTDVLGWGD